MFEWIISLIFLTYLVVMTHTVRWKLDTLEARLKDLELLDDEGPEDDPDPEVVPPPVLRRVA